MTNATEPDLLPDVDLDPEETQEWIDALTAVIDQAGPERAHYLIEKLIDKARRRGAYLPYKATTAYKNTITLTKEERHPGDLALERKIGALIRWNAVAMVIKATKKAPELGGHIASFASAAVLYEIAFNHFFRAPSAVHPGDLVYFQGHCSPGIYARAFLEGRLSEAELNNFRQEVEKPGLSSYPHPWLMKDFWQFATVSMGLGPLMAIYQARFLKYLSNRELVDNKDRKVWVFCGDGEMDEPESLGAISLAAREKLDNLIFVINCNLQRLDGPVRGNGKIIQELEGVFRGAGWNVIKVVWGRHWDPLFAQDHNGLLLKRMEEAVDGDYQNYKANDGAYVREHFFGKYPELAEMVAGMSDQDIWRLNRGGHDPLKVYAAYAAAVKHTGQPTVILAKTIKGYGMGAAGEAQNTTHQTKKMSVEDLKVFRDRFQIPVSDQIIDDVPFYRPAEDSEEIKYLKQRREALGGSFPQRREHATALTVPALEAFASVLQGGGDRESSTTMAFVRLLGILVKDPAIGKLIVPIIPDECRTFGMEGMFRQLGIYSAVGQLYKPVDSAQLMYYKEDIKGQILEEGITEAGAMSSWIAAATSYSSNNQPMIPFFIYYSMFGFQRIGDLAWAAGDMQARGFLLGGTAGRTTLAGEGLQHQDGHSHLLAATIPNCVSYDPCYGYELAVIIQDGLRRMYAEQENIYYYLTVMNENYLQPAMPDGVTAGILKGMYLLQAAPTKKKQERVQLLGSGTILREVLAAAELLARDHNVVADVWSVTSFTELRREALAIERANRLAPTATPATNYVHQCLADCSGPIIAATDYIRAYADQIRPFVSQPYITLGTDGYGRSDTREQLRRFFEVDRYYIAYTTLHSLAMLGRFDKQALPAVMTAYGISAEKADPMTV